MEQWRKWITKHLGYFIDKPKAHVPQDIRSAHEEGMLAIQEDAGGDGNEHSAKRQRQDNAAPSQREALDDEDDAEDKGTPWIVNGPYLEPDEEGGLH